MVLTFLVSKTMHDRTTAIASAESEASAISGSHGRWEGHGVPDKDRGETILSIWEGYLEAGQREGSVDHPMGRGDHSSRLWE